MSGWGDPPASAGPPLFSVVLPPYSSNEEVLAQVFAWSAGMPGPLAASGSDGELVFRQRRFRYERALRQPGSPKYDLGRHALTPGGLVSLVSALLRLVTRLGALSAAGPLALAGWIVSASIGGARTPPGWTSLSVLILGTSAVQLVALGILGGYLASIFREVKGRPTYLIARTTSVRRDVPASESGESLLVERRLPAGRMEPAVGGE